MPNDVAISFEEEISFKSSKDDSRSLTLPPSTHTHPPFFLFHKSDHLIRLHLSGVNTGQLLKKINRTYIKEDLLSQTIILRN